MASQSEGIQRLLEAEKEAQKDVDAARRRNYLATKYYVFKYSDRKSKEVEAGEG